MTRILVAMGAALVATVGIQAAFGQPTETPPRPLTVVPLEVRQPSVRKVLPPVRLPNIQAEVRRLARADRTVAVRQLAASTRVLRFWAGKHQWLLAKRHTKCFDVPWQRTCTVARASQKLHLALAATAQRKIEREIPYTTDWATAVKLVQRPYPGTESFLMSCSGGEGGHGGFVMNRQGSGAAGWMQFMPGTFYGHAPQAFSNVRSLGFVLPDRLSISIESPLAQAITAAYMRTHGMSSHWDPRIDPLCA